MTIVVHTIPGSPFARMALLTCEEKGVPWRIQPMAPGQHKQPEHLARHPFGRVPAIEHDGYWLYEAQAIMRYLDAAFDGPALTPTDPKQIGRMAQVMNILDWYVMPSLTAGIGFNRIVAPIFGIPPNEEAVQAAIEPGRVCLKALEDLLGAQPYFAGDRVSLADLMAVAHLDMVPASPEGAELIAGSPLLAWLDRMAERPSVQRTAMSRIMAEHAPAAAA
jgi:glutathione S-transferase